MVTNLKKCHNMLRLNLNRCSHISNISILRIAEEFTSLQFLENGDCPQNENLSIVQISKKCHKFQSFYVEYTGITSLSIRTLAEECPEPVGINVSCCTGVDDSCIVKITKMCPQIQELDLTQNDNSIIPVF